MRPPAANLALFVSTLLAGAAVQAACPPAGETAASLQSLKGAAWRVPGDDADARRQTLALALLDCLADPDPVLRDELAFEALSTWMRGRQLGEPTVRTIHERLLPRLDPAAADAAGFAQPFAALTLAEVARVDRLQPFLSLPELAALVERGARYLSGVRDYRGHDPRQGWRHGVAHGADLMLQLSLNPRLERPQLDAILAAIASQVVPPGVHAYRDGEPERLMAPVFYIARRGLLSESDWRAWFAALAARRDTTGPVTTAQLAQRHNLGGFLSVFYVAVQEQGDAASRERLLPGLRAALKTLD